MLEKLRAVDLSGCSTVELHERGKICTIEGVSKGVKRAGGAATTRAKSGARTGRLGTGLGRNTKS
jgi:hypothetical protein